MVVIYLYDSYEEDNDNSEHNESDDDNGKDDDDNDISDEDDHDNDQDWFYIWEFPGKYIKMVAITIFFISIKSYHTWWRAFIRMFLSESHLST